MLYMHHISKFSSSDHTTIVSKRHFVVALHTTSHISLIPLSPTGLSERLMFVSCSARHAGERESIFATVSSLSPL